MASKSFLGRFVQEEKTVSCSSLKKYGFTESNIYSLKSSSDKFPRLSYCNMEGSDGYDDPNMENLIGYLNYMPIQEVVMFSAYQNQGSFYKNDYMTFNNTHVNYGNDFNLSRGTFIAPTSGTYGFSFSAKYETRGHTYNEIHIERNNVNIAPFQAYNDIENGANAILSFTIYVDLAKGDTIRLKVANDGEFYCSGDYYCVFSGKFLRP